MEAKILVDSTQSLVTFPRVDVTGELVLGQAEASPAPTARVGTPSTSMPEDFSSTGVTRDSISVLTTAAAAKGATQITVASAAWRRGRRYVVKTTDGHVFEVTCRYTVTGTTLYLTEPLPLATLAGPPA